jgi:ATP-dependent helicase/nuclease subunit A
MRHLQQGNGLDRLLVVTFTEAAAAGMKDKITEKLHSALAGGHNGTNPEGIYAKGFLARQAALLPGADISTIHAFCRKLVKANFQQVNLDPAFRVGDEAELGLIKTQVMGELFEEEYQKPDNRAFLDLSDVYGGKAKDERLETLVLALYDFLESDPFPLAAAARYAGMFGGGAARAGDLADTPWYAIVRSELAQGLAGAAEGIENARALCLAPGGPDKYLERLEQDAELLRNLRRSLDNTFQEAYAAFAGIDWGRLPSIGKKDDVDESLKERVQKIRNIDIKKTVDALAKGVFFAPPDKMRDDIIALSPRMRALMELTARFAAAYAEEKRARCLMDFSDLEHFAIRVLYPNGPEDMNPGPVAEALSRKYHEVLIDEYQDANRVQELILSAVSKRRFMVGDVKQSIYRFRRADPSLFKEKHDAYIRWDNFGGIPHDYSPRELGSPAERPDASAPPGAAGGVRIDLSQNFRSRAEVLDGINFLFSRLMCGEVGEVSYDDAAALKPGAAYPPWPQGSDGKICVDLLDDETEENEGEPPERSEPQRGETPLIKEARMISRRVRELLDTRQIWDESLGQYRPCRLGDMVILTRSLTSIAPEVIQELKNNGIPAAAEMGAAFFEQTEVKTALAFLNVTDNPRQSIELAIVLHSPVYNLTPDEMLRIRQCSESADLYDCVLAWAEQEGDTPPADGNPLNVKLNRFLSDLARFRDASAHMPVSRLIGLVYDTTRYPAHAAAMSGGTARLANLRLLLERAIAFEETRFTGLFHFTRYIKRLHESNAVGKVGAAANESTGGDCLRLMTVHKSKGLEFPIVFVSFLGRKFNLEDERAPIVLHGEKGLGPNYTDTDLRTVSNTLPRFSLQRLIRHENLSEELRCLYVAMTRAMQCLVFTGRTANLGRDTEKWGANTGLSVYARRSAARYLDWIMPCLMRTVEASPFFDLRIHRPGDITASADVTAITPKGQAQPETRPTPVFPVPLNLPSKLSISEIKRLYASDLTPDSTAVSGGSFTRSGAISQEALDFDPPAFFTAGRGLSPARMGAVLHTVTEHMDYNVHTHPQAIDGLISSLTEKNLITPEEAAAIDRKKIDVLANSPLADRIRAAGRLYREVPFVMALPADEIYPGIPDKNNDSILVHGIIDCYFEEDGQIVLVDFKSDAFPDRHATQLEIYKKAVARATAMDVKEALVYSFALGDAVSVSLPRI